MIAILSSLPSPLLFIHPVPVKAKQIISSIYHSLYSLGLNHIYSSISPPICALFQDHDDSGVHDGSEEVSPGRAELHSGDREL